MGNTLVFHEINTSHIPLVNSWHTDTDSSYVEELSVQYIKFVTANPNYFCWIVSHNDVPIGQVAYEIEEQKANILILIRPGYRRRSFGKQIIERVKIRPEILSIQQIVAGIMHTNEASINFFKSVGFDAGNNKVDTDGFIDYFFTIDNDDGIS